MEIKEKLFLNRYSIVSILKNNNNIGIELGVAEGNYSYKMMETRKFSKFFGIDSYDNFPHDNNEFIKTKNKLFKFKNYKLIKNTFEDSLSEFSDNYFDYIYIDGFAYNGNESGKTLIDWFKKVKIGGIIAGDDYHKDWPIIQETIMKFCKLFNFELCITGIEDLDYYSQYPSWYFVKTKNVDLAKIKFKNYEIITNKNNKNMLYYYFKFKSKLYYFLKNKIRAEYFRYLLSLYKYVFKNKKN